MGRYQIAGNLLGICLLLAGNGAAGADPADPASGIEKQSFELHVVGPDGKPIPQATVEIRTNPKIAPAQIRQGKFVRTATYGTFVLTDEEGLLVVDRPRTPNVFDVNITTAGYGPYWAAWSSENHSQAIPAHFTAELESGWSVGGIVVDEQGHPIAGVEFRPSIRFKKRAGDLADLHVGTNLKTDALGRWRFDSVPASKSEVSVAFGHPAFMAESRALARGEFEIEPGHEPGSKITLRRGLTVEGQVIDQAGKPIVGALVRTKFLNDIREAKTNDEGAYQLVGCQAMTAKIVVSAKGQATDMKELRIDPDIGPVDFQMQPGGKIRLRVLDEHDQPVARARIFFQYWRGSFDYFEFNHVSQYADKNGVWEWNEAPLDAFAADICRPDGMDLPRQSLMPREEEYVFRPPPALVISGKVIDAETNKPIKVFQVMPGIRFGESQFNWATNERFTATEGQYRLRQTHGYFAHMIRVEAEGYRAAVSRDIKSNEGQVSIDFELEKGVDVSATVLKPDGKPAAGAKIALGIAGSQISVQNGDLDGGSTIAIRCETDDAGRFRIPPQEAPFQLVITHPAGYAHIKEPGETIPETVKLIAWSRVEGVLRVGQNLAPNAPITINTTGLHSYGPNVPNIFTSHDVTTDKSGRFVFERVVPGVARIGRRVMLTVGDGAADATSSCMVAADFAPGETSRIELGGTGRPAVGTLQAPRQFKEPVNWQFALVQIEPYMPGPPPLDDLLPDDVKGDAAKTRQWMLAWQETEAGRAWTIANQANQQRRESSPRFSASVTRDGTFRVDDMPSGQYSLSIWFSRDKAGELRNHLFSIPPLDDEKSQQPVDLGVLPLK